jgi:outer membrane lipoprotein-sorting protein
VNRSFLSRYLLICAAASMIASAHGESLPDILARMDRAAKDFKSMSAQMKEIDYTAVIDESTPQSGEVRMKRAKGGTIVRVDYPEPEPRIVHADGHKAEIFYPKAKSVEIYDIGKYSGLSEQILIGFATSGDDLRKNYTIKVAGMETVGGQSTTRLQLTPKSPELLKLATTIELWIPEGQSYPLQEKFLEPSKNYKLVTYSGIKMNPELPDSAFELKLPPGTKQVHPQ